MREIRHIGLFIERSRAFGRELCEGIITYAQDRPWELIYLSPDELSSRRLKDFDGFIARVTSREIAEKLKSSKKPVIDVFYNFPDYGFSIVKENHEAIGQLAAEHFLDRKFQNFAYCPFGNGKTSIYCRNAYHQRLRRSSMTCLDFTSSSEIGYLDDGKTIIKDRIAKPRDATALIKWIKHLPKPIGVFCPDDVRAWQLLEVCSTHDISVPDEIAILGLDNDILICGGTRPMLSSIDPNTREIGRTAAETLEKLMTGPIPQKRIIRQIYPRGVVCRASTETFPLNPPWLSEALVFIKRNAPKNISASDVFTAVGRSHTTVTRAFKEMLHTTVQQTIANARLDEAKRLLTFTNLPISEVAAKSGFSSHAYFFQSFSAATGISPSHWRAKNELRHN